jgi:threonylcarbamoyladenosine tRNA methylthiotransferase MtaB
VSPARDELFRLHPPPYAVFLDSIGCRLNQAEMESLAAQFVSAGCEIAAAPENADWAVVNSCSVTNEADRDSRQKVRQIQARNPDIQIALTGCWSTLHPQEAAALPGVRWVIVNESKEDLVDRMLGERASVSCAQDFLPAKGARRRTRAFIPAQLGCDFSCAYCVTRLARGAARSMPADRVVRTILAAEEAGAREAVLTGVQLGAWGKDIGEETGLCALLQAVLSRTHIPRIRISSLEPWNLTPALLEMWSDDRLCPHLHLPLQSGSAGTLRRMARPITPEQYARRVEEARRAVPDVGITTDIMVGFPGETEAEFEQSKDFVRAMRFGHAHIFSFSARPGTPAESMPGRIAQPTMRLRAQAMENISREAEDNYLHRFLGGEVEVLWEAGDSNGIYHGWTRNALRVRVQSVRPLQNRLMRVRCVEIIGGEIQGALREEE